MRVELDTSVAGASFSFGAGVYEVGKDMDEAVAFELLRDGIAKLVSEPEETAMATAMEAAVTRGRGRPAGSRNRAKSAAG